MSENIVNKSVKYNNLCSVEYNNYMEKCKDLTYDKNNCDLYKSLYESCKKFKKIKECKC